VFSGFVNSIKRMKKPFNPLLGETFEFVDSKSDFRFISEQVSHHPPISAGYGESADFKVWGDTNLKSSFSLSSLEITPLGGFNVVMTKFNDHFKITKCKSLVKNLFFG
jgi:oxysterol-binding protein 1